MRKKELVLFVSVFGVVVALSVFAFVQNKARRIQSVVIDFETDTPVFMSDTLVNKMLKQKKVLHKDQFKDSLDLGMLESLIEKTPVVANTEAFLYPDGRLGIRIEERIPVLQINRGRLTYFLDIGGQPFELPAFIDETLPSATGDFDKSEHEDLIALVKTMEQDPFLGNQHFHIRKDNKGYQLQFSEIQYPVQLGKLNKLTEKINKLKAFRAYQITHESSLVPQRVNLAFDGQVVVTN